MIFSPELLFSIFLYLSYIIGGVYGIIGARTVGVKTMIGQSLSNYGIAVLVLFLGFLMFDINTNILQYSPILGFVDLFFLLAPVYFIYGTLAIIKIFSFHISYRMRFESMIILLFFLAAVFFYLKENNLFEISTTDKLFDLYFIFTDAILISMVYVSFRAAGGKMIKGIASILIALTVSVLADIIFIKRITTGDYFLGDYSDLLYLVFGVLMSIGIMLLVRSTRRGEIKEFNTKKNRI